MHSYKYFNIHNKTAIYIINFYNYHENLFQGQKKNNLLKNLINEMKQIV